MLRAALERAESALDAERATREELTRLLAREREANARLKQMAGRLEERVRANSGRERELEQQRRTVAMLSAQLRQAKQRLRDARGGSARSSWLSRLR